MSFLTKHRQPFKLFFVLIQLVVILGNLSFEGYASSNFQISPNNEATKLLEKMSPEERVGQLFLVSFQGINISEESHIYDLITNYHVSGVILQSKNNNFTDNENTPLATLNLIRDLQQTKWEATQLEFVRSDTQDTYSPSFIPLFIGISQDGDGYPNDQILNGLTALPSLMSLGATWKPSLAEKAGEILGLELSSLGFNLLIGPSLDVLETPKPENAGDLGTRTFGGDPFWVGQFGRAFIKGVHTGSDGKLTLIAKHFPGNGGANRLLEEEVPTVRKSLEQLKQIELAPFFAVTGDAPDPASTTDGLFVTHIRYQGFQGNIRATTRPVSLDEQALNQLLNLPRFASWRENGGIIVSDDLGLRGLRRLLDPDDLSFNARLLTRDAFLAGNDLLFLGNIVDTGDPDSYTTSTRIINFFVNKYREDIAFAQRVDESVLRILTQKFENYPSFTLNTVLPAEENLDNLRQDSDVPFEVALQSATLISPSFLDIDNVVPNAPGVNDRIVFITDSISYQQCITCTEQIALDSTALQQAVLRLYGPTGGAQTTQRNLSAYTFSDLVDMLENPGNNLVLQSNLRNANWIVFSMLKVSSDRPVSRALRRFLSERPDLTQQKQIIVFSFNAPYYLDATDISKITAYYGLYSKTPQAIDIAARILFKELTNPPGALPVSVQGIGYELISATSPDPDQTISVILDLQTPLQPAAETLTPEPTAIPIYSPGELVPIRTSIILDHNGRMVPDGTLVSFYLRLAGEETRINQVETRQGIARMTFQVPDTGPAEVYAYSEPAIDSSPLRVEVPVIEKSPTVEPTITPTETLEPTATITDTPPPVKETPEPKSETLIKPEPTDWMLASLVTLFISLLAYRLGITTGHTLWSTRWGLMAAVGGALTYTYISIGLPGTLTLLEISGHWGVLWSNLVGAGLGWGGGLIWQLLSQQRQNTTPDQSPPSY